MLNNEKRVQHLTDDLISLQSEISRLTLELAEKEKRLADCQNADNYFQTLFEAADEAFCICDSDGQILKINENAANLFGLTQTEMQNTFLTNYKLKPRSGKLAGKSLLKKHLKNKFNCSCEFLLKLNDGSEIVIDLLFQPHHTGSGILHLIRIRDISAQRMINGNEKRQREFLERLVKERTANLLKTNSKLQKEIRDRVQREKELTQSKELYKELVEKAGVAILIDDENGNLQYFNKKLSEIFGYSQNELKKKNFLKLIHPDDVERIRTIHKKRFLGLEPDSTYELKAVHKGGRTLYLDLHTSVIQDNGHIKSCRTFIWDRTDKTLIEAARIRSEQQYRDLYDNNRDGIIVYDLDGNIVECNPVFEEMIGYPASEIARLANKDITPEKWIKTDLDIVRKQTLKRGYSDIYQKEYIHKNGNAFPVELRTYLIRDDTGNPEGFWAIIRDISDRKKIEVEMNMLVHTVKSVREAVCVTDLEDNILFVNEAFLKIYGYKEEELIGNNIEMVRAQNNDPDMIKKIRPDTINGGWVGELINRRKNGEEFPIYLSTSVIHDDNRKPIALVGISSDQSERKKIEAQLRQSQKMDAVGKLAGGIAHDFNNILSVINGYSDLALHELDVKHPLYRKLSQVRNAGEKASNLVKQLLAFGRKQIIETKIVNINKLISDWNSIIVRLIGEDIETVVQPEKSIGLIKADPNQLEQVFVNLLLNARDAINQKTDIASEKKIKIRTKNIYLDKKFTDKHRGSNIGQHIEFSVSDTGVGIHNGTKEKIFEPFFTTKEEGKGTGLGLSMVYGIVKQNNGMNFRSGMLRRKRFKQLVTQFLRRQTESKPSNLLRAEERNFLWLLRM
ncbi:MAG: PAS domain S-box protein [Calditrichaceae bacterium]